MGDAGGLITGLSIDVAVVIIALYLDHISWQRERFERYFEAIRTVVARVLT